MIKKTYIILLAKIVFIALAFWLVIRQVDLAQISNYIKQADILWLFIAAVFLNLSFIASSYRSRYYLSKEGLLLTEYFAGAWYYVGILFNNLLPGSIGGDAYKIYLLKKLKDFPKRISFRIMLSERANGLFAICILIFVMVWFTKIPSIMPYGGFLLFIAMITVAPFYFYTARILLKEKEIVALGAFPYSLVVQVLTVLTVLAIIFSMYDISLQQVINYSFIFLVSSIVSVVPVSIGGVGLREVTFLYGAKVFAMDVEVGVAAAFIYFIINLLSSLIGVIYYHKLPSKVVEAP